MRTIRTYAAEALRWVAAVCLVGTAAHAQQEQWLKYTTSTEPRAYRWRELSTNAPGGVRLPSLQAGALFGSWESGLDSKPRWLALDRTTKSGLQNRLFIDRNGNGHLDDETPITATHRDQNSAAFGSVKLVFKGPDGAVTYHVVAQLYQWDKDRAQMLLGSGCCYEGTVTFAGKKIRLQLVDQNVNGAFNDIGQEPHESDRISLGDDGTSDRFLGRYLEVQDKLFSIEVAKDGAFIKVKPAEGVEHGKVKVPEEIVEVISVGELGHFVRKPEKGEFNLPSGKYRVNGWKLERKDVKGAKWALSGYGFGPAADFEVKQDALATLSPGEPIRCLLSATENKGQVAFSLRLVGHFGESLEIMKGGERPRAPQLLLAGSGNTFRATNTFEYG